MKKTFTFLVVFIAFYFGGINVFAARFYVKQVATGNGSGTDWNNASANLQSIIDNATYNDEIWVAFGTYKPNSLTGGMATSTGSLVARDVSFVLKSGVKIYGGFFGDETLLTQRTAGNITILSGDLGTPNDVTDNAYHVVISVNNDSNTLLDGVSITGGYAYGTGSVFVDGQTIPRTAGGGMYFRGSALVLNNVKIYNNESSLSAGGIYVRSSQPTFNNSEISNNKSATGAGIFSFGTVDSVATVTIQQNSLLSKNISTGTAGAINLSSYSTASFTDVTFSENTATHGGAVYSTGVATNRNELNLLRVNFSGNVANAATAGAGAIYIHNRNNAVLNFVNFTNNHAISGGAIFVQGVTTDLTTEIQLINSSFTGNTARDGGGLFINSNVNATVENNSFKLNLANATATGNGGGAYIAGATVTLKDNSFSENVSNGSGGGTYITGVTITIEDNNFKKNTSGASGGGMYLNASISSIVQNNRFYENIATAAGGGIFLLGTATTNIIENSLFYKNSASNATLGGGGIYVSNGAKPTIKNCTFYENHAVFGGGALGLFSATATQATVANCIFYANTSNDAAALDIHKGALATLNLFSSITQQFGTNGVNGVMVGVNPVFANISSTASNFLMLSLTSPAIDHGDDGYLPSVNLDLAGNPRRYNNGTIDIGAFENQGIEPLPIVLTSFTAKAKLNHIRLDWGTQSELNNAYFLIERSFNGNDFSTLATLAGKGTYSERSDYYLLDQKPQPGLNYYRLKQIDLDGKVTDYGVRVVEFRLTTQHTAKLYPNPATSGKVQVLFASQNAIGIEVINTNGMMMKKEKVKKGATTHVINLEDLPPSLYLIRILNGNSQVETHRVIKQ
ncbi:right-handed parallel beta-helix repeat-containing protein [Pedobacter sp. UBA4863]|uniref:right-handed parallel beta-helix repeat-containing protein n=1 Tax=Pedobacter sp. UBA4863 TaxID=1947060 RepID=UPI0025F98693|nr:right-handed parallel beta-helix repeat-containing protein [Pedobacter sp. UBA4863]